jgi:hypothetical protein
MPRSVVIGNGNVLVGYDANYSIRDLFFPHVGLENQTVGNVCRTGFFVDGRFAWLEDPAWQRRLGYWQDTLVTDVTLTHPGLGITVHFADFVDMVRDYLIRKVRITSVNPVANLRAFFHHDWYMRESDLGTTVLYEPEHRAVIAYKGDRWALAGGNCGDEFGISSWATGKKGVGLAGTWVDAEDGELGRNPIDQGSVDSTIAFHLGALGAGESREFTHWVVFGKNLTEVTTYGQDLICTRDADTYLVRTRTYWDRWSDKEHSHIEEALGAEVRHLYRRSVLTVRTQVDNHGGIVAANDYDITKFARDTYSYVWSRTRSTAPGTRTSRASSSTSAGASSRPAATSCTSTRRTASRAAPGTPGSTPPAPRCCPSRRTRPASSSGPFGSTTGSTATSTSPWASTRPSWCPLRRGWRATSILATGSSNLHGTSGKSAGEFTPSPSAPSGAASRRRQTSPSSMATPVRWSISQARPPLSGGLPTHTSTAPTSAASPAA